MPSGLDVQEQSTTAAEHIIPVSKHYAPSLGICALGFRREDSYVFTLDVAVEAVPATGSRFIALFSTEIVI